MIRFQAIYPTIRLAVAALLLAIGLRTWLVMGIIDPVTVSGSSMVPSHLGASVEPQCPVCEHRFTIGAEFASRVTRVTCPNCSHANVSTEGLRIFKGDRLWVDRLTYRWREPRRWESVVARNPTDASELCIKRIVGLPGEQVDLRDGDVRIDGAVFVKSNQQQQLVQQLVHAEAFGNQRWQPQKSTTWRSDSFGWHCLQTKGPTVDWLRYRHPNQQPITDDVVHNAGLTRRLNKVDQFLLRANLSVEGDGSIFLRIDDGTSDALLRIDLSKATLEVTESGLNRSTLALPPAVLEALAKRAVSLELTNFDQQLLFVIDGQVALRRPWPRNMAQGTSQPFSIGSEQLAITLADLKIYRDIYHTDYPVGAAPPKRSRWLLGPGEFFLLGDNSPVSIDSRLWGPVPRRLLIGKPLW